MINIYKLVITNMEDLYDTVKKYPKIKDLNEIFKIFKPKFKLEKHN